MISFLVEDPSNTFQKGLKEYMPLVETLMSECGYFANPIISASIEISSIYHLYCSIGNFQGIILGFIAFH